MNKRVIVVPLILAMSGSQVVMAAGTENKVVQETADARAEGNLSMETAAELNLNEAFTDNLSTSSDEKWYKATVNEAGYISLEFTHDFIDSSGRYWTAYLYGENQEKLAEYYFDGNVTSYKQGNIGVPAGEYYIKITDRDGFSDKNYNVTLHFTASEEWETEFNDSFETADEFQANHSIYGALRNNSDVDWYKVNIPEDGYISLEFTHGFVDSSGRYWTAYLYGENQQKLAEYYFDGNVTSYKQGNIGVPAGDYYVKITDRDGYSDKDYSLKINFTSADNWETEFNDEVEKADEIKLGEKFYGSLMNGNDVDWYKFTVPENGEITLDFYHGYIDSKVSYWRVYLYDPANEEIDRYLIPGNATEYRLAELDVDAGTYFIKVTDYDGYSDGDYSIKIDHSLPAPFPDVENNQWYTEGVRWAVNKGITSGYGDGTFKPDKACTRSEAVTFLWRVAEKPEPSETNGNTFSDVKKDSYYYNAVLWAAENGITSGYGNGQFKPDEICTRAQIVTFIWRMQGEPKPETQNNPFTDVKEGDYYYNAVLWAVENGITSGISSSRFAPNQNCTRSQIVTFLYREFGDK